MMNFFPSKRLQAGIEISAHHLKSAVVFKKGNIFSVNHLSAIKIPPETVKPSFKTENIIDEAVFHDNLEKICKDLDTKRVSLALPDSSVKVLIRKFKELPKDPREIDEMLTWSISTALHLSADELRISWENKGKAADAGHIFLIALGLETVIAQYEEAMKKVGISPTALAPAGLHQFNFYAKALSEVGKVAYLGLFDDFVNIFVFCDGAPVFYKTIKKGVLNENGASAINDMDVLIQFYNSENPDLEIEKFYIASHIKSEEVIKQILPDVNPLGFVLMDENDLIEIDKKLEVLPENGSLFFFKKALGAAQGQ